MHRGLIRGAALLIPDRDVHQVDVPAEAERDEFAERHQVPLAVALRRIVILQPEGAVEVLVTGLLQENAEDQRRVPLARKVQQGLARVRGKVAKRKRKSRLRQHDQVGVQCGRIRHQREVALYCELGSTLAELQVLRDVALDQLDVQRLADRVRPLHPAQQLAARDQQQGHP